MTPSELKYHVEISGVDRYFFTRDTMKFYGDTMANYGVREATIQTHSRSVVRVWELYRKRPVKLGLKDSAYFTQDTYERVFPKIGG